MIDLILDRVGKFSNLICGSEKVTIIGGGFLLQILSPMDYW